MPTLKNDTDVEAILHRLTGVQTHIEKALRMLQRAVERLEAEERRHTASRRLQHPT